MALYKEKVEEHMPADFKEKYPSTRVIIDCTEIRCPRVFVLTVSFLAHKKITLLWRVCTWGCLTFISQLYTGHISDRKIVMRSWFLNLPFARGDSVIADKGFTVQDLHPLVTSLLSLEAKVKWHQRKLCKHNKLPPFEFMWNVQSIR